MWRLCLQLWRVSASEFQLRTSQGYFLACYGEGCSISTTTNSPSEGEIFYIERNNNNQVHIKLITGAYLQVYTFEPLHRDLIVGPNGGSH
jgi:hypothetical protein